MKKLFIALMLIMAQPVAALQITAKLDSFAPAQTSLNGGAQSGGLGTFTITGGDNLSGTPVDFLTDYPTFEALCLEPSEFVSTGGEYVFEIVPLSAGPTLRPGGMGNLRQDYFERAMGHMGFDRAEEADNQLQRNLLQAVAWETAFETENVFSLTDGTAQLVSGDLSDVILANGSFIQQQINNVPVSSVDAYALLNVGQVAAIQPFGLYRGQDFAVWERVPAPAPMALLGAGLLAMFWRKSQQEI